MNMLDLSALAKEIRGIVASVLEIDEEKVTPGARFVEELGMDSMMALEILASVEKRYKIKIPEEYLAKVTTLNSIVGIAERILKK
jgi:acyl carrier protein